MTPKEKATRAATPMAQVKTFTEHNSTKQDPFQGWHDLAKPSRSREQKRSWQRGNQRGCIDPCLIGQLLMLAVIASMIVGGLNHA